ncbi:MAG: hypothetical protein HOD92_17850 [Deltaproteobacteria bacterium]|jgi:predicted membrane channel-forming protein YqfA (hemolysin III family)|nr:hypothetical protein [Deltaproteobacteria bacterium]
MGKHQEEQNKKELIYHLVGWILFIICAFFFLASSWQSRDTLTFIGSVLFLIACFAFVIPLIESIKNMNYDSGKSKD